MNSKEEVSQLLGTLLVDMFEVEPDDIKGTALLYDDLDVDSIDAIDLVVELRQRTGKQIDPEEFKAVRTVDDVVTAVAGILELK